MDQHAKAPKRTVKTSALKLQPINQPSPFVVPPLQIPQAPIPASATPLTPVTQGQAAAPLAADLSVVEDSDLIEKEWVNKAKQIVTQTQDDPYKQSEELTMFKAEYMKKRYDKHIKLSK